MLSWKSTLHDFRCRRTGRCGNPCVTLLGRRTRPDHPAKRDGTSILYTRKHTGISKIKELKEKGYQLKAIRMILHNKNPEAAGISLPDSVATDPLPTCNREHHPTAAAKPDRQNADKTNLPVNTLSAEERMAQFRELMSDIVGHAIAQNNEALTLDISKEIRETVLKEMNYLIREQNDMTEERYRQLSAEIRGKLQKKHTLFSKKEKVPKMKTSKKKRTGKMY